MALIEKKVKAGQTKSITVAGPEKAAPAASNVVDLVALLKQSLGGKGKARSSDEADEETEEDEEETEEAPAKRPARKAPARAAAKPAAKTAPAKKSAPARHKAA
jgi:DNA end-binding protein Ku